MSAQFEIREVSSRDHNALFGAPPVMDVLDTAGVKHRLFWQDGRLYRIVYDAMGATS